MSFHRSCVRIRFVSSSLSLVSLRSLIAMVNWAKTRVFVDGQLVTRLRVLGLVVEAFLRLAFNDKKGLNALRFDLVRNIFMNGCTVSGRRQEGALSLDVSEDLSALGYLLACDICDRLENRGFRILDAISKVSVGKKKLGEHDLVCERRNVFDKGKTSVEIKLRHVAVPDRCLGQLRLNLRDEAVSESALWQHLLENEPENWRERCVLLYDFPTESSPKWRNSYCEACAGKDGRWTTLWGWPAAEAPPPDSASVRQPPPTLPISTRTSSLSGDGFKAVWQREQVRKNSNFASVGDLLEEMRTGAARRKRKHLNEHFLTWPKKLKLKAGSLKYFAQFRSRTGGCQLPTVFH